MINNRYYKLTHHLKDCRITYLYRLLLLLVSLLLVLNVTGCKPKKATVLKYETIFENKNEDRHEEAGQPTMLVQNTTLIGNTSTVRVTIKAAQGDPILRLEDFKLKVAFLSDPTYECAISYSNLVNQKQTERSILQPLTKFKKTDTRSAKEQQSISVSFKLLPTKQATRLVLGMQLLDNQDRVIRQQEVTWRRGELLVHTLSDLIEQTEAKFILENATTITFDTSKVELALSSDNEGIEPKFIKTNTSRTTLRNLLEDNAECFSSDVKAGPIGVEINDVPQEIDHSETKLIITQNEGRTILAQHNINWLKTPHALPSETKNYQKRRFEKQTGIKRNAQRKDNLQKKASINPTVQENAPQANQNTKQPSSIGNSNQATNTLKQKKSRLKKVPTPNHEEEHVHGQQYRSANQKGRTDVAPDLIITQEHSQNLGRPTAASKQPGAISQANFTANIILQAQETQESKQDPINAIETFLTANLSTRPPTAAKQQQEHAQDQQEGLEKPENQKKETVILANHDVGQAHIHSQDRPVVESKQTEIIAQINEETDHLNITSQKQKAREDGIVPVNVTSVPSVVGAAFKEPTVTQQPSKEPVQEQQEKQGVRGASNQQQELKKKGKSAILSYLPELRLSVELRRKKNDPTKYSKKFIVWIENKGKGLNKEAFNNIRLKYNITESTGDLSSVKLKRGSRADVNEVGMSDLLGSSLDAGQKKRFELTIDNENTNSLIIKLFLEGVHSRKPVVVKWQKEEKSKEEKNKPTSLPNTQMSIGPREVNEAKFTILLETIGRKINRKALNNIQLRYTVIGKGDTANVRLKKGRVADINGIKLEELLQSCLKEYQTKEIDIKIESANADSLAIKLFLEGVQGKRSAVVKWEKAILKSKKLS